MTYFQRAFVLLLCLTLAACGVFAQKPNTKLAIQQDKKGKYGLVDTLTGETVVDFEYDLIVANKRYPFFTATKKKKRGLFNAEGELAVPFVYDGLYFCQYLPLYLAEKDGAYGAIDTAGRVKVPFQHTLITDAGKYLTAQKGAKKGLYDDQGRLKIAFMYDELTPWNYDVLDWATGEQPKDRPIIFIVKKGAKTGVVTETNRTVVAMLYESIEPAYADDGKTLYFIAQLNGLYGLLGPDGKALTPFEYSQMTFEPKADAIVRAKPQGVEEKRLIGKNGKPVQE